MLRAICYSETSGWSPVRDLTQLSELRQRTGNLIWAELDVLEVKAQEVQLIADELELHPLAVDDAMNPRQRPKLEVYDNHIFAVLHQLDPADGQLEARQLACFIGVRYILIVHAGAGRTVDEARGRLHAPERRELRVGASFLVHTLIDTVVDGYQQIADDLEDEVERVEELLLATPRAPVETTLYSVKQRLARFRRFGLPVARILDALVQGEAQSVPPIEAELAAYFRDIDDHTQRIAEQIRNADDLATAALDLYRMHQANALNEVTKRLTGWAAIIAVPTFIASVYGMNFRLLPPDQSIEGFVFALGLMMASAIALYVFFKRRDWL